MTPASHPFPTQIRFPMGATSKKTSVKTLFPFVLLACNLGAAAVYAAHGDWRRAVYWAASSVCIAAVTL